MLNPRAVVHLWASYNPSGWESPSELSDIVIMPERSRINAFIVCAAQGETKPVSGELVRKVGGGVWVKTSKRNVRWAYQLKMADGKKSIVGDQMLWAEYCEMRRFGYRPAIGA